jgi:tetratricopeptide (TPR) repeat protein
LEVDVSHRCLRLLAALIPVVFLTISVSAQTNDNITTLKGELHCDQGGVFNEYRIELTSIDHRADSSYRSDVQSDGSFQFREVRSGLYSLNVSTLMGNPVHQELVNVMQQAAPLKVRLPGRVSTAGAPGTISVKQLLHPPNRKAFQAFAAAQRFSEAGNPGKAAVELERAIKISPDYADAYNNLAVQYMRLGRYEDACQELVKSLEVGGPHPQVLANLAYVQRHLRRYQEALVSAKAALRLDNSSAAAHLVIGSILASHPDTWAEGVKHLEIAAQTLASGRASLALARRAGKPQVKPQP